MQLNRKRNLPLKFLMLLIFICINSFSSHGQLLKRIGDGLKSNAESKATDKVNESINKGIDSLTKPHSKKKNVGKDPGNAEVPNTSNNTAGNNSNTNTADTDSTNTYNTATTNNNDPATGDSQAPQDGFIVMSTSANSTFPGGSIIISGESVIYEKFNSVTLTIKGPYTEDANAKPIEGFTKQARQIPLDKDGKFTTTWNVGGTDGQFILTVASSDAKATKSKSVIVNSWPDMGDIADSNIQQTNKAYDKLVKKVDAVKPEISSKDAGDLDKKNG